MCSTVFDASVFDAVPSPCLHFAGSRLHTKLGEVEAQLAYAIMQSGGLSVDGLFMEPNPACRLRHIARLIGNARIVVHLQLIVTFNV